MSMRVDTSCVDWADRLKAGKSIIPAPIYLTEADRALAIFKELRVFDLPGKPTFGEVSEQWVFDFVRAVFGAYDVETGNQLIREFFLLVSKKNTKSTVAAAIMLTAVILCWRHDEEHLIIAPTVEIAGNSFKPAAGMVRADEELSDLFHVQDHIRTITHRVTRASLKIVAADTDAVSGKKAGRVLIDEAWLFGSKHNASSMFMEATGGQVSRSEGFTIFLSTQSDEPPAGVFKEKLNYFRDVRDGKVHDPKSLPILYEFPQDMLDSKEYLEPDNFGITNPNLGRSVSKEWIEDNLRKLKNAADGSYQQFLAKHLNVEIGMSLRNDRWRGADHWETSEKIASPEELIDRSEVITLGVDGGGLDDLLGFAALGREKETGKWLHYGKAWAHKSVLDLRKEIAPRLLDFAKSGDLVLVDSVGDDTQDLADLMEMFLDSGLIPEESGIGFDPAGINFDQDFSHIEMPEKCVTGVSQGWRLGGTIKTLERKLAEGMFGHCNQAMMAWCVGNAKVEQRSNSILITKQASGKSKIDPLMALLNAAHLMALNPESRAGNEMDSFFSNPAVYKGR